MYDSSSLWKCVLQKKKKKKKAKLRIVVLNYTINVTQTTLKLESHLKSLVNVSCLWKLQLEGHETLFLTIEMQREKVTENIRNLYNTDSEKFQYWCDTQGNLLFGYLRCRHGASAETRGSCELLAVFWLREDFRIIRETEKPMADLGRFHGKQPPTRNETKYLLTSKPNQTKTHLLPWK